MSDNERLKLLLRWLNRKNAATLMAYHGTSVESHLLKAMLKWVKQLILVIIILTAI